MKQGEIVNLLVRIDERQRAMEEKLDGILVQTTKTNGRVQELEKARASSENDDAKRDAAINGQDERIATVEKQQLIWKAKISVTILVAGFVLAGLSRIFEHVFMSK